MTYCLIDLEKSEAAWLTVITSSHGKYASSKQNGNKDTVNSTDEKLTSFLEDLCQGLNKKVFSQEGATVIKQTRESFLI